jgi:hypothetical protein
MICVQTQLFQHFLTSQGKKLNAAKASLFLIPTAQRDTKPSFSALWLDNITVRKSAV